MAEIKFNISDNDYSQLNSFCEKTGLSAESLMNVLVKKTISEKKLTIVPFKTDIQEKSDDLIDDEEDKSFSGRILNLDDSQVIKVIKQYDPYIIAIILSLTSASEAALILENLDSDLQVKVFKELTDSKTLSNDIIEAIVKDLEEKVADNEQSSKLELCGIKCSADIINLVNKSCEKELVKQLEKDIDSKTADEIRKRVFTFEDLATLNDRGIQTMLREVDANEIAKALKSCPEEVSEKIFNNMSKRACEMLKEDIEFMGPVRLKDVEEAQQKIVAIVRRFAESGQIIISRCESDAIVD